MITKAEIQLVRSLDDKRTRSQSGLFVAEGEKLITELRASHLHIRKIYSLEGVLQGVDVEHVSTKEMERLTHLKTPSNSLALVEIPKCELHIEKLTDTLVLALDGVQNPGNMGTIIRLADWFGITDIVCSETTADCFNPKVVQATMGAILRVRVHYLPLISFLDRAVELDMPLYGTFLEGENIYNATLSRNGVVVMGNEGRGVSDQVAGRICRKLLIPPYPDEQHTSESLNVAMATGIVCSEFRRRTPQK